jgi:hypothetical protein
MTEAPNPSRLPSDLTGAEAATARWFVALPRATAPAWPDVAAPVSPSRGGPRRLRLLLRPFAAAAAVVLALALPAQGRSISPAHEPSPWASPDAQIEVAVVDDPSVPMLHGLETFDQLAFLTQPEGPGVR